VREEEEEEERGPVVELMLLLMVWANEESVGCVNPFCPIPWIVTGPGGWLPERVTEPVDTGLGGPALTGTDEGTEPKAKAGLLLEEGRAEEEEEEERLVGP